MNTNIDFGNGSLFPLDTPNVKDRMFKFSRVNLLPVQTTVYKLSSADLLRNSCIFMDPKALNIYILHIICMEIYP